MRFLPFLLPLAACTPATVTVERPVEVKVPVSAPCVLGTKPSEPASLQTKIGRQAWNALTTDQREKLLASQALSRKAYGDELTAVTSGCK